MKKLFMFLVFGMILLSLINLITAQNETETVSQATQTQQEQIQQEQTTTETTATTEPHATYTTQTSTTAETTSAAESQTTTITGTATDSSTIEETSVKSVENLEKLEGEFKKEELNIDIGITPDSNFYFIEDKILSKFRDDLKNRERKVGEIREMIKKGDLKSARVSLEKYKGYAESLEKEVDPEKREEARRSAAAIYNNLKEIENELSKEDKKEFIDDIFDKEKTIVTAAEISNKIKVLCEQLAGLDPSEYSKVCMIKGDAPKWQKKLNQKLTKEQEKEAKEFGDIMAECFKTSGNECRCNDISFYDFSVACSKIAPLASACDKGNEDACEDMESINMPELPSYLQNIFDEIEGKYKEAQIDLHMPKECTRAGAKDKKSCMLVMFQLNAPEECIEALKQGKINSDNEREARKGCEEIMFKENAPEECVRAGIKDPKECGKFMFKENAPEECIEAGLTGESRNDEKKCRDLMESKGKESRSGDKGFRTGGMAPGSRCMQIQDPQDRLICFEEAVGRMGEDYGIGDKYKGAEGKITSECREHRIHEPSDCERFMREELPKIERQRQEDREKRNERYKEREREIFPEGVKCPDNFCDNWEREHPDACPEDCIGERGEGDSRDYEYSECKDGCSQECPGASRTDCVDNGRRCQCFYEERQPEQPMQVQQPSVNQQPIQPIEPQQPLQPTPSPEPTPVPEPTSTSSPEFTPTISEPSSVTGGVIRVDNKFLDYWFKQ